jgi:hypothetical protein
LGNIGGWYQSPDGSRGSTWRIGNRRKGEQSRLQFSNTREISLLWDSYNKVGYGYTSFIYFVYKVWFFSIFLRSAFLIKFYLLDNYIIMSNKFPRSKTSYRKGKQLEYEFHDDIDAIDYSIFLHNDTSQGQKVSGI